LRHISTSRFGDNIGAAKALEFEVSVCKAVYGVLRRAFDIDFAFVRADHESILYWYEIHPEFDEFHPLEPGSGGEGIKVREALVPLFSEIGTPESDSAIGQEFFMGHNWLRVAPPAPVTFKDNGDPVALYGQPLCHCNTGHAYNLAGVSACFDPF
jgi:hypothetical protein